jgi:fructose-1,6-bisphosphatase/inositol monophosphatase family enzyme
MHIALEVQGATEVAVVTSPALRRCWWATRDGCPFESSWPREPSKTQRLKVSTTSTLDGAVLDALDSESGHDHLPSETDTPNDQSLRRYRCGVARYVNDDGASGEKRRRRRRLREQRVPPGGGRDRSGTEWTHS